MRDFYTRFLCEISIEVLEEISKVKVKGDF